MPAHLYVEHLVNIGTLSVQASLPSVRNDTTKLAFSADGRELTLWHDGKNTSLRLPTEVPESTRAAPLHLPSDPSKELHIRLPLNGATQNATAEEDTIFVSWSAPSLTDQTEIVCSACQNVLVRRGTISQWKDLPSEGWAEMMEFWHCHKPDVPDDQHVHANDANPATTKGYAAGSQLSVVSEVGLVSPMELAFAKRDVVGVDHASSSSLLSCYYCHTHLGLLDTANSSLRLRKTTLAISNSPKHPPTSHLLSKWLCANLLLSAADQGTRVFLVRPLNSSTATLMLWLFAPDNTISSSVSPRSQQPMRVAKVLWKDCQVERVVSQPLNGKAQAEGELELPAHEFEALKEALREGALLLPEGGRVFVGWNAALLERFTALDLAVAT